VKTARLPVALILWSLCALGSASAQSTPPPNPGLITPTPTPAPSPAPVATARPVYKPGPVLIGGKSTFIVTFGDKDTQTFYATQAHAPQGGHFTATPGTLCLGAIKITGDPNALLFGPVTSSRGEFTVTRVGSPIGCSVSISSSAGGQPAVVVFQ
jgi:hypothetical protein